MLLEVCVDDAEGLAAAVEGGADRIELCSALDVGGLTPSAGLMELAGRSPIPVYAMIRPRAGDFVFDEAERRVMLSDIRIARASGLTGVVLGASRSDGRLDFDLLAGLAAASAGLGLTLHRAFDLVPDPFEALEQAVELGLHRILTSGQARAAADGADLIRQLVERADGRIAIMAGSGITTANVTDIKRCTGINEVHGSCRGAPHPNDDAVVRFGFATSRSAKTSCAVVREMKAILSSLPNN